MLARLFNIQQYLSLCKASICSKSSRPRALIKHFTDSHPNSFKKNDAHGTTDSHPGSCHPKSTRMTDNIAVRAGLDLQSDEVMPSDLCGAAYRSTF